MVDLPQPTRVDQLLGERDRRDAAVVVPDRVRHAGRLDRLAHFLSFGDAHREGLFTENHLPRMGGLNRNLFVQIVRHADIYGVDVVARN